MSVRNALDVFDQASQKHEKEIVLELGMDRVLQYLGVYMVICLVFVSKFAELFGGNLTCFPQGKESKFEQKFVGFAETYCWESPVIQHADPRNTSGPYTCPNSTDSREDKLLRRPALVKGVMQWAPYGMLLQAFIFSLPSALWHFRVGSRLMGHLKFMRLFLEEIYASLKELPGGVYEGGAYDEHSAAFNERAKFTRPRRTKRNDDVDEETAVKSRLADVRGQTILRERKRGVVDEKVKTQRPPVGAATTDTSVGEVNRVNETMQHKESSRQQTSDPKMTPGGAAAKSSDTDKTDDQVKEASASNVSGQGNKDTEAESQNQREKRASRESTQADSKAKHGENASNDKIKTKETSCAGLMSEQRRRRIHACMRTFFLGDIKDRHFFSMLCFENFSSLEHHPYLLSIFRVTHSGDAEDTSGIFPMNQGILRQWCHRENFSGRFLVGSYVAKHIAGILISIATLISMGYLLTNIFEDEWVAKSFRCDVIYHEHVCVICTMKRKTDFLAFLVVDAVFVSCFLLLSVAQWILLLSSVGRVSASFFEHLNDLGSVAMLASMREKITEKRRKKEEEREKKSKQDKKKSE